MGGNKEGGVGKTAGYRRLGAKEICPMGFCSAVERSGFGLVCQGENQVRKSVKEKRNSGVNLKPVSR
jgi:hypothetical protein